MELRLKFKKSEVLAKLKENRTEHERIVREAQKGFREKAIEVLRQEHDNLVAGKKSNFRKKIYDVRVPTHHLSDYDRAIKMLESCTNEEIVLGESTYECYIENNWGWQENFLLSNSVYSDTAQEMSKVYQQEEE